MTRKRLIEKLDPLLLDTSKWPIVLTDNLSLKDKERFIKRKSAIDLYLGNKLTVIEIKEITGINRVDLNRLIERCLKIETNGTVMGYRGPIFYKRLVENTPRNIHDINTLKGKPNSFKSLLLLFPQLQELIENLYLKKKKNELYEPVISMKHLHQKVLKTC